MSETVAADASAQGPAPEPAGPAEPDGHLELSLHPDDAARLARLPELAALRAGRTRQTALHAVWFDSPDGKLAGNGLALSEHQSGRERVWRLERLRGTPQEPWPPGTTPPLLGEAATAAELGIKLPEPLVSIAACDGTLRSFPLTEAAGGMSVTLLQATLRAVAGERPVCRLLLSGPPARIAALTLAMSQSVRLTVPDSALATEAYAVSGRSLPPLAIGAPVLPAQFSTSAAFAALTGHLTGVLLHWAPLAAAGVYPEPVHQMRVALRRLRSAIALFRRATGGTAPDTLKADIKSLLQVLGPARDLDVFVLGTGHAVATAMPDDKQVAKLLAVAGRRRAESYAVLQAFLAGPVFRRLCLTLACLAAFRPWEAPPGPEDDPDAAAKRLAAQTSPLRDFAAHALSGRLQHVLAPGEDLSALPPAELHALRIQGKRLRYAAEFFAPLYPGRDTRRFLRRTAALQERLGRLNDNEVAAALMGQLGNGSSYAAGVVRGFVAAGQRGARTKLDRSWRKFRRAEPFWL